MSTYDSAHGLAKALQQSEEYRSFLAAKQLIEHDETAKKMVRDFIGKQMEFEYEMMAGKPEDKAKVDQLQKMYDMLMTNARARDFMQAHMRLNRMMGDVYKIIGDSVAEGMNFFAKE
jgi:cell fate (sporulation/competence/biofilm development) regulator YlbF (YheA/YmcA/DUF963 family)